MQSGEVMNLLSCVQIKKIGLNQDLYLSLSKWKGTEEYMVFQKDIYNFEGLYKFIQRICEVL
jgi:hypothetical protein